MAFDVECDLPTSNLAAERLIKLPNIYQEKVYPFLVPNERRVNVRRDRFGDLDLGWDVAGEV